MVYQVIHRFVGVTTLVAVVGIWPLGGWAQDNDNATTASTFIQHFDKDGDGQVSADEFPGEAAQFSELDSDADGYLNADEAPQGPPRGGPAGGDLLAENDTDGDNQLSASEFPGPEAHFTRLDSDGDGYLTSEELAAGRPGPPPGAGKGFEADDADGDGQVSKEEFSGPADVFSQLDTDSDGYISEQEAQSAHPRIDSQNDSETNGD